MSYLTGSQTDQGEQASALRGDFNATLEGIRNDRNLSPEGRANLIQSHYDTLTTKLKTLEAQERQTREAKVDSLRKSLFGLNGYTDAQTAINYRDAEDRVASLKDEKEALKRLDRAHLSNDEVLTQSIVQRAIEAGWDAVLNAWSERNPSKNQKLQELRNTQISDTDIGHLMNNAMTYSMQPPREIARRNGY